MLSIIPTTLFIHFNEICSDVATLDQCACQAQGAGSEYCRRSHLQAVVVVYGGFRILFQPGRHGYLSDTCLPAPATLAVTIAARRVVCKWQSRRPVTN